MGRVAQRGDVLATSVELVDARDRRLLWGEQYNIQLNPNLALAYDEYSRLLLASGRVDESLAASIRAKGWRRMRKPYTVSMARPKTDSTVLTLRVPVALEKRIAREARRRRQTRSEVARAVLEAGFSAGEPDLASEARRQSLLASRRRSDRGTLRFMAALADMTGWRGQE